VTRHFQQSSSSDDSAGNGQQGGPGKKLRIGDYKLNIDLSKLGLSSTANRKQVISYMALGGTASGEIPDGANEHSYETCKRSGEDLLKAAHIPHNVLIRVEPDPPYVKDSKDVYPNDFFGLRDKALQKLETANSVLFTHGSCTMDLAAFFLYLTMQKEKMEGKKIIFEGAMRAANHEKPDGPPNRSNALRFLKKADVSGIFMSMNATGEIFSPPYFGKRHASCVSAFEPLNGDIAAKIEKRLGKHVVSIKNKQTAPARTYDLGDIRKLPYVPYIQSQGSIDPEMIIADIEKKAAEGGALAIVYGGTGMGSIHKDVLAAIPGIIERTGVPIIRATKAGDGEVEHNGGLVNDDETGTIAAGKLVPDMAVLLAQVAIAEAQNKAQKEGREIDKGELHALLSTAFREYQTKKAAEEASAA
jgi:L-asparaginase